MVCTNVDVGAATIGCLSASTNYFAGYGFLILAFAVLFWKLNRESIRERMAASLFATSIISMLMSFIGLVPERAWTVSLVLMIGAGAMLIVRD